MNTGKWGVPDVDTRISSFQMLDLFSVTSKLTYAAKEFTRAVWPSLKPLVIESKARYQSGIFGDVKLMTACMAGRIMVTMVRGDEDFTVMGTEEEPDRGCGVHSIEGSARSALAMVDIVIANWEPRILKRDDTAVIM